MVRVRSRKGSLYIPIDAGGDASTGDEVLVKIVRKAKGVGEALQGKIIRVISRASGLFVGTYFERGDAGMVKIDGTTFSALIYVGDPGEGCETRRQDCG